MSGGRAGVRRTGVGGLVVVLACFTGCAASSADGGVAPASTVTRAQAHLDLARGYLDAGNLARARGPLLRALELDPERVEAHVLAGVLYEREQEAELAARHFKIALELDPADPQALNNYGAFLYGQGRFQAALRPLCRAVRSTGYRLRAQAYENLGLTELALGRTDAARLAFERALHLGGAQGATARSANHAEWLRMRSPKAISSCR